jgi:formiminotetrahydrofolate cyclodeaminase
LTIGRKKYAPVEKEMRRLLEQAHNLRGELTAAIKEDSEAFEAVMQAYKLPRESAQDKKKRSEAIQSATLKAAQVPLDTAEKTLEVMRLAQIAADLGNLNAVTDAWSSAELARAAISCAGANVRINLASLKDEKSAAQLAERLSALESDALKLLADIKKNIKNRAAIELL